MKRSACTEAQPGYAIRQPDQGVTAEEIWRKTGISEATFYDGKKKYGGFGVAELRELRMRKEENARLRKMVADLRLDKQKLQDVIKESVEARSRKAISRVVA